VGAFILLGVSAGSACAAGLQSLLPPSGSVDGWKLVGTPRTYDGNSLYELVDGEGDAIKAYSFVSVIDGRYSPSGTARLSVDINIYDMSDPLDAFGLYSHDREGAQPWTLAGGVEAARTTDHTGMSFWKGRYLVRLASTSQAATYTNGILKLANAIDNRMPGTAVEPALLHKLPAGASPRSQGFDRSNVAGHAFLKNAVTARYPSVGDAELFIAQYGSAAAARAAYSQFANYERSNAGMKSISIGQAAFAVLDRFARNVVVAVKGPYLAGIVRANSMTGAQALVRAAAAKL
jgi:hypothetical protein